MNDERGEEYATEVGGGVLVVAGGDSAPLLEAPETPLDGVAFAVAVLVECRWSTAGRSFLLAASDLVAAFGDGVRDSAFPQVRAGDRVRVRLVGQQPERFGVVGAMRVEQRFQVGVVARLSRREQQRQRATERVGESVDLGAQTAAGAAECVVGGLVGQILVIRPSPLCAQR